MTMDYENPDYHAVVVKLAALSQLGLTLVHNNNEYSSSASNTIEGQTDMLRCVCMQNIVNKVDFLLLCIQFTVYI